MGKIYIGDEIPEGHSDINALASMEQNAADILSTAFNDSVLGGKLFHASGDEEDEPGENSDRDVIFERLVANNLTPCPVVHEDYIETGKLLRLKIHGDLVDDCDVWFRIYGKEWEWNFAAGENIVAEHADEYLHITNSGTHNISISLIPVNSPWCDGQECSGFGTIVLTWGELAGQPYLYKTLTASATGPGGTTVDVDGTQAHASSPPFLCLPNATHKMTVEVQQVAEP